MPAILKNGTISAPGGRREGAGRKPEWLKLKCQKIVEQKELVEFLGNVASGKDMEQVVTDGGEVLKVPASIKDRLKAVEILLNRGFGKDVDVSPAMPDTSVQNAEKAYLLLKEMESRFENRKVHG